MNLWIDVRYKVKSIPRNVTTYTVKNTVVNRLFAELDILFKVKSGDIHFIFGNLPPLFKSRSFTVLYLQNRLLIEKLFWFATPTYHINVRTFLERIWFRTMKKNISAYIVQTESMAQLLKKRIDDQKPIHIIPFISSKPKEMGDLHDTEKLYDFIYPASGESHKNHNTLIDAWIELSKNGLRPSLVLTVSGLYYPNLLSHINLSIKNYSLNIKNIENATLDNINQLYQSSKALIYPSLIESLGLPLIEANNAGLAIIASELDYVRDIVTPTQTFNPVSYLSIARAVERHLAGFNKNQNMYKATDIISLLKTSITPEHQQHKIEKI